MCLRRGADGVKPDPTRNTVTVESYCPRCGAQLLRSVDSREIKWSDKDKAFRVRLGLICGGCGYMNQMMSELPVKILKKSNCSCGSSLVLKDYDFKQKGDKLEFTGRYECPNCNTKKRRLLRNLTSIVARVWSDTKSIQIGPDGVTYERITKGEA